MATYYVSASATGGGNGSSGNPWTLSEAVSVAASGGTSVADIINIAAGTYQRSSNTIIGDGTWIGAGIDATVISASANMTTLLSLDLGSFLQDVSVVATGFSVTNAVNMGRYSGFARSKVIGAVNGVNVSDTNSNRGCFGIWCQGQSSRSINDGHGLNIASSRLDVACQRPHLSCCYTNNQFQSNLVVGCVGNLSNINRILSFDTNTLTYFDSLGQPHSVGFNPFVDESSRDLRLTTQAKTSVFSTQIKAIMAGLVGVPGITADPLEELIGGGGTSRKSLVVGGLTL